MKIIKFNNPSILFFLIVLVLSWIEFFIFVEEVGGMGGNIFVTAFKCFADIAMIYIFYWFLPRKYKWIILIVQFLLSIFFVANLWNYRFWGTMLSPLSYKMTGNLNSQLFSSITGLWKGSDLFFFLLSILSIAAYFLVCYKHGKNIKSSCKIQNKIIPVAITILLFLMALAAYIVSSTKYERSLYGDKLDRGPKWYIHDMFNFHHTDARLNNLRNQGLTIYFLKGCIQIINDILTHGGRINLSEESIIEIDSYIQNVPVCISPDTIKNNINKNLIIVIVESLNSNVINKKINGHYLTPVMNGLISTEGTVSSLNMRAQVKDGYSNDGQLIVNTGLLPIDTGVTSDLFGSTNHFPSLPRIFNDYNSVAIFGDLGNTWNQTETFQTYGFSEIYSEKDFLNRAEAIGNDGAMFEFGESIIPKLSQPFLLEFVTISSHVPFKDKGVPVPQWLLEDNSLDATERDYYAMIHYFDKQLGNFINFLKKNDLWRNSILVVTSDHNHELALSKDEFKRLNNYRDAIPIVFIAANTGVTKRITTPTAQVNVFPTILQIMDAVPEKGYHGLGRSLLDPELKSAVDSNGKVWGAADSLEINRQRDAFRISNLIHRGNYFANKY